MKGAHALLALALVFPHIIFTALISIPWNEPSTTLNYEQLPFLISLILSLQLIYFFPVAILNILNTEDKLWLRYTEPFMMSILAMFLTIIVPYLMDVYPVPFLLWTVGPALWAVLSVPLTKLYYDQAKATGIPIQTSSAFTDVLKLSLFAIGIVSSTLLVLGYIEILKTG
jgi:hypothetical protein